VFTHYDPTIHPFPAIGRITERERPVIDRYRPKNVDWYVNYQGAFFEDRLNVMAGYREEKTYNRQQQLNTNPPWYTGFENMLDVIPQDELAKWEISQAYQRSLLTTLSGDSIQYGATFAITPDVNIYAGYSQSYLPNGGGKAIWDEAQARARAIELGRNPDTEVARVRAQGADDRLSNEEGTNAEVGIKTTLFDNKIVATVSLFRLERTNRRTDDVAAQTDEPLNYNAAGARTGNIMRWFSAEATQRTEGTEFEVIWTPNRNYQLVGSAGYLWTAKTVADPSIAPTNVNRNAIFNTRLVGAPKHSLNIWNKYTFTEGGLAGFTVGGGMRYRSEMTISQSRDWDASRGGVTSGDYTVFDALLGYNTEIWGMQTNFSLNITNVFDKMYMEGGWNYARGREIALTTRLTF
jgi:outer membrane receptor protein involved in Fe transport